MLGAAAYLVACCSYLRRRLVYFTVAIAAADAWNGAAVNVVAKRFCGYLRRRLDECATALAAADAWASTRLGAVAISAVPRRVYGGDCGGDCGGGRVKVYGGVFVHECCGCGLRIFRRRLDGCAAASATADECLCTLAAAVAAAEELK